MGDFSDPSSKLGVEFFERTKATRGKERVAQISNVALDFTLFVTAVGCARFRSKVVMTSELKNTRIQTHESTVALDDDALEIVVEQRTRNAAEVLEGFDVSLQKALHYLVQEKTREYRSRIREHHVKT